jgi:predicted metal-binding protein
LLLLFCTQEMELDRIRAANKALLEERDKLAAADQERQRVANEKAEKKRKADTEKATALFETVSSLWNEQVRQSFVARSVHACCGCGGSCSVVLTLLCAHP